MTRHLYRLSKKIQERLLATGAPFRSAEMAPPEWPVGRMGYTLISDYTVTA